MPRKKRPHLHDVFPEFGQMRIKYKDVFDLKEFYTSLHEWLMDKEWIDEEGDLDHWESYYGERISQNGMREIWIQWRIKKTPEGYKQDNPPLMYYMDINFHCLAITGTEVVRDGMKMKVNKGEVELYIKPYIQEAYLVALEKKPLTKTFVQLFRRRVYRKAFEQHKKELYDEAYVLNNYIKQWFKLKRYLPYEETKNFFPSYAWPSHLKE